MVSATWWKTATLPNAYRICETLCFVSALRCLSYLNIYPKLNSMPFSRVLYQSGANTSPNGRHGCNVVTFYIWDYFTLFLLFCDCVCIVCNDYNAVCYQYSLWHYDIKPIHVNLKLVPVSLKGTCVFWICKVITENKSTLVQQMAWCRQAKSITSLPEPHTRTHTQIPLLLVITYLRICSTPQGPMV